MRNFIRLKNLCETAKSSGEHGRWHLRNIFRHKLGLANEKGQDYTDRLGNRMIAEKREWSPDQFSIQELAEACIGPSWRVFFDPAQKGSLQQAMQFRLLTEKQFAGDGQALLEATGAGIDPTAFIDINTWSVLTAGLLEFKVLEAWNYPNFIGDEIFPIVSTKMMGGQKLIGTVRIGDQARIRRPGEPHPRAQFGERWITTPELREIALGVDVSKEAVFADLTGEVLANASSVGEELRLRKEYEEIDTLIGATYKQASPDGFKYKDNFYNTFNTVAQNQPSGISMGYVNQISNPLLDITSLNTAVIQFSRMTNPDVGASPNTAALRVSVMPDMVIVPSALWMTADLILGASEYQRRTAAGATQATAQTLIVGMGSRNPFGPMIKKLLTSPILEQRMTDAVAQYNGLGLALNVANQYWWMLQQGKPFAYYQNWPLIVQQAPANTYEMLDKGIAASVFANERGKPVILSPWHVILNTN